MPPTDCEQSLSRSSIVPPLLRIGAASIGGHPRLPSFRPPGPVRQARCPFPWILSLTFAYMSTKQRRVHNILGIPKTAKRSTKVIGRTIRRPKSRIRLPPSLTRLIKHSHDEKNAGHYGINKSKQIEFTRNIGVAGRDDALSPSATQPHNTGWRSCCMGAAGDRQRETRRAAGAAS